MFITMSSSWPTAKEVVKRQQLLWLFMGLVGKLQNDYFLVLKFRQSLKRLSQNMVLKLVIA